MLIAYLGNPFWEAVGSGSSIHMHLGVSLACAFQGSEQCLRPQKIILQVIWGDSNASYLDRLSAEIFPRSDSNSLCILDIL